MKMNLPNKLTIARIIITPFFLAALLWEARVCAAALSLVLVDVHPAVLKALPQDVDGYAAGRGNVGVALGAADVGRGDVEGAGHLADDLLDGDRHRPSK